MKSGTSNIEQRTSNIEQKQLTTDNYKMPIRVEFYGVARRRSGVAEAAVETEAGAATLGGLLRELGRRFPDVADACLDTGRLRRGFVLNLNGERFVSDADTALRDGDVLLLMSADAGG